MGRDSAVVVGPIVYLIDNTTTIGVLIGSKLHPIHCALLFSLKHLIAQRLVWKSPGMVEPTIYLCIV